MGRRNYLIEGGSGTGKTSVCRELRRRGFHAVNGDRQLAYAGDPETGEPVPRVAGVAAHRYHLWRIDHVRALVASGDEPVTFFCGGSRNASRFLELFDIVFVLQVDLDTLRRRLDARPADEWGGPGRVAERELIERLHISGEELPRGGVPIDATAPLETVVDRILEHVTGPLRR
ncbi:AAA family ATPase [Microbacterium sp. VKM Ac-2923]|uniref:AAA family ATPase n=1 Tax=Microbacterium sp. VKM Ac-2923 TaxID=2929476 RepID=UPI001FB26BC1|nr:AAA family ATPase [Microbacterium sp. VKM Ac-2923]MCJ1706457.1 AAA family ATPase [Microbacterium sp. VKM Ac-2923]